MHWIYIGQGNGKVTVCTYAELNPEHDETCEGKKNKRKKRLIGLMNEHHDGSYDV